MSAAQATILLLRHGAARGGEPDPELSEGGLASVARTLAAMPASVPARFDVLLHSPLRRAARTAACLADARPADETRVTPALLPDAEAGLVGAELVAAVDAGARSVAVVAHLPILPELARWLCDATLPFSTGCGWCLRSDALSAGRGTFEVLDAVEDR